MPQKSKSFYALAAAAVILIAGIAWSVWTYNSLGSLMTDIQDSQNEIDDLMQRQADVIPKLTGIVGAANLTGSDDPVNTLLNAREQYAAVKTDGEKHTAILQMQKAIDKMHLYGLDSQALAGNAQYKKTFKELADDQNKIYSGQGAINKFDTAVKKYNSRLDIFPANIIAALFHYTKQPNFELSGQISQSKININ